MDLEATAIEVAAGSTLPLPGFGSNIRLEILAALRTLEMQGGRQREVYQNIHPVERSSQAQEARPGPSATCVFSKLGNKFNLSEGGIRASGFQDDVH